MKGKCVERKECKAKYVERRSWEVSVRVKVMMKASVEASVFAWVPSCVHVRVSASTRAIYVHVCV